MPLRLMLMPDFYNLKSTMGTDRWKADLDKKVIFTLYPIKGLGRAFCNIFYSRMDVQFNPRQSKI